jgi:hypothetical protein
VHLNVYVPKEKEEIVKALNEVSRRQGKQKNELVLEALKAFLEPARPTLGVFHLGEVSIPRRDDLYLEHWDR